MDQYIRKRNQTDEFVIGKLKNDDYRLVAVLKGFFAPKEEVLMAFLFGSAARGQLRNDSDVDIAVYLAEGYTGAAVNALWDKLEELLKRDVDLLLLNKDNPTLAWSALRGLPLLIRDHAFYLEYMLQVSREAEDFQDFIIDLWKMKTALRGKAH